MLFVLLGLFIGISLYFAIFGPRVPVGGGLGWDGQDYGAMAQDFSSALESGQISTYRLVRALPSLAIGAALRAGGIHNASPRVIALAFAVANLMLVLAAAGIWWRIGKLERFPVGTTWMGFTFLFVSYATVRHAYMAPVSTDYFAYFLGIGSLYFYLQRATGWLFAATIVSCFTWPVAFLANAVLLACPRCEPDTPSSVPATAAKIKLAMGGVLAYATASAWFIYGDEMPLPHGVVETSRAWVPIALVVAVGYFSWVTFSAFVWMPRCSVSKRGLALFGVTVLAFVSVRHLLAPYASTDLPGGDSALLQLRMVTVQPVARPGQALLAHIVWWGPWFVLFVTWMPQVFAFARRFAGLYFCVALFAVFCLYSESRAALYFAPFAVFAVCGAAKDRFAELSRGQLVTAFVLALVASRFWLPMTAAQYGPILEFPAQAFMMQMGPWMGEEGYVLALTQAVTGAGILALVLRRGRKPSP